MWKIKPIHSSGALFLQSWQGWEVTIAQHSEDWRAPLLLNKAKLWGDRWQMRFTIGCEEAILIAGILHAFSSAGCSRRWVSRTVTLSQASFSFPEKQPATKCHPNIPCDWKGGCSSQCLARCAQETHFTALLSVQCSWQSFAHSHVSKTAVITFTAGNCKNGCTFPGSFSLTSPHGWLPLPMASFLITSFITQRGNHTYICMGEARATHGKTQQKNKSGKAEINSRTSSQIVTPLKKKVPVSLKKSFLKFSF